MFYESYVLFLWKVNWSIKHKELYFKFQSRAWYAANCNDSHLDTSQDGEGAAAKDGVL